MRPSADHPPTASSEIAADDLYAMVSDIPHRVSPETVGGPGSPTGTVGTGQVGDWFVGENETPERSGNASAKSPPQTRGATSPLSFSAWKNCTWWATSSNRPTPATVTERGGWSTDAGDGRCADVYDKRMRTRRCSSRRSPRSSPQPSSNEAQPGSATPGEA